MSDADIVNAIKELGRKIEKNMGSGDKKSKGTVGRDPTKSSSDLKEDLKLLTEYEAKLKKLGFSETARFARLEQSKLIAEKRLEIVQAEIEAKNTLGPMDARAIEKAEKELELADKRLTKLQQSSDATRKNTQEMMSLGAAAANAVLPLEKSKFFNIGAMKNLFTVLNSGIGGMVAGLSTLGIGLIENFIGGIIDTIFALDEMESSLQKTTGMSAQMARNFASASDDVSQYFISIEQYGKAVEGLYGTFTDFTIMSQEMREEVAATTSVLMEWGVSAQTIGTTFQFATKMMGQTASQANTTALEISSLAMNIGVPIDQMMNDFNTMMPQLAKLGPTASDSFREMARVSKITGLEVQKLLALTNKFDTFEGAAEMAGQLNAALGGNFVNAMDMMTATDPVERFEMLRGSLEQAGLTFDDMSYYQRQFFAESMGLDSVGDLALMMSGNMGALGEETNRTARDYEQMAQAAAEQATLQEKFDGFLQDIMRTLVDEGLLDSIHEMFNEFTQGKGPLIEIKDGILDFVEEMKKLKPLFKMFIDNWRQILDGFIIFKTLQIASVLIPIVRLFGAATMKLWGLVAAKTAENTADVQGILAKEGATAAKIRESAATDKDTISKNINTPSNYSNAASVSFLAAAASAGAPVILALGAAFLMMGLAVGVAAFGVSYLVDSFAQMSPEKILASSLAIFAFGVSLAILAKILVGALPLLFTAETVILSVGASFLMMGAAVAIAAFGMSYLVDSFKNMSAGAIAASALAFLALGGSILILAKALGVLGTVGLPGILAFGAIVAIITVSMISMIEAVGNVLPSLGQMFSIMGGAETGAFAELGSEMETIAEAVDDMNLAKVLAVTAMIGVGAGRSPAAAGGGGGGGASGGSSFGAPKQRISITLDAGQTEAFLRGITVETEGTSAQSGVGIGSEQ